MAGPVQSAPQRSVIAPGNSGLHFAFTADAKANVPPRESWHTLPLDNPYRKEWDSFARDLGLSPRNNNNFGAINAAINGYVDRVLAAEARNVPPSAAARSEAIKDVREQLFAPKTTEQLQALTGLHGSLTLAGEAGAAALARDPALAQTAWGAAFQANVHTVRTQASFAAGFAHGMFEGGKDMAIGLATIAGKTAQYLTDNSLGLAVDPIRELLPTGAQQWMRSSEAIPSAERGRAATQAMADTVGRAGSYIADNTPAQMADDIKGFVSANWNRLEASHAQAAAQGPQAEARWWGEVTGRAAFEVAALAVPATKVALANKADKAADLARASDAAGDAGRVAETMLNRGRRIIGDLPLNSGSLDDLFQAGKLTMDEARALAKSVEWKDAAGRWIYPPNEGFHKGFREITLKRSDQIIVDRYGDPRGTFASSLGEPDAARALPPGTDFRAGNYHIYKVESDINVRIGTATPWFDQPGGGIQYALPGSVKELKFDGVLTELRR